jgi:hypothetical protein
MRTLRTAAWINVGLHVAGLVFAAAAMKPGTPAAPLVERIRYLAARPLGWSAGWLVWMLCALALVAFMFLLARAHPSPFAAAAATLAILGAVVDVTCDLAYILVLPARAAGDVSSFLVFERRLGTASLTGANGLYSLSVLVATLGLPASALLTRGLGVLTFVAGLVLAGAGLTGDPRHVIVGTALTIPLFLAWSLAASSSPHPR